MTLLSVRPRFRWLSLASLAVLLADFTVQTFFPKHAPFIVISASVRLRLRLLQLPPFTLARHH